MVNQPVQKGHYGLGHIKRLRARAALDKISTEEKLELLLSYAIRGKDVKPQARELFKLAKGNLNNAFNPAFHSKVKGIGSEAAFFLSFIRKLAADLQKEKFILREYRAGCQADVVNYFKMISSGEKKESVHALFLDAKNRIIEASKLSEGTVSQSLLYPREIIKRAITCGALGIIIVHNHPSGDPAPSENDRKITRKLLFASREMDINLLDHIVIGGNEYYSFYEQGLMAQYNSEHAAASAGLR